MDLNTEYLGMKLKSPLVPSASPLSENLDAIFRMEDAGAAAIVMHSLFEEQLRLESAELYNFFTVHTHSFPEALTFFPEGGRFHVGPEQYLEHIRQAKASVGIPIIVSLNGTHPGRWMEYARDIEQAGADALELNLYSVPVAMDLTAQEIEDNYLNVFRQVKEKVKIPVAVKLSPFFTNFANVALRFCQAGAGGLVLFNRFYQPDLDLENLEIRSDLNLSRPADMRLPLRWIALLYGKVPCDLAGTSGIHNAEDVLKMLMAGASITMLCGVLLKHGIEYLRPLEKNLKEWMEKHEYSSVRQMRGSMSQLHCEDPAAYERAQYVRILQGFRRGGNV